MKKISATLSAIFILFAAFMPSASAQDKLIKMSTTTSTQASGLLDVLLPELKKDTGIEIKVIAKGTGAAIRDGEDGNVDVIFVHAKAREEKFVTDGFGTQRYAVMHNDFVILGPKNDPAGIKGMTNSSEALKKIAQAKALFVSRGDDSGTHTKEQDLWKATGLKLKQISKSIIKKGKEKTISFVHPAGDWYLSIGQGMGKTLTFANEKQAYTISDRGTYIKYKMGRKQGLELDVLCEGDSELYNPYGVIPVNPKKFPHVQYSLAKQFAEWLISPKAQTLIADYKLLGQQLFQADALVK